jgi:hypothetical protein
LIWQSPKTKGFPQVKQLAIAAQSIHISAWGKESCGAFKKKDRRMMMSRST